MNLQERSQELGRLVGQSEEYQALKRANDRLMQEAELRGGLERLRTLQITLTEQMDRGEQPTPEQQAEVDGLVGKLQAHPTYQAVVAGQANFDKLMYRINDWILEGIKKGAESRIITLG
jgi:cell fate (sporulation/competence/biofilm development) regulator YlbF (YheA/YmcA/DUF963 family)